MGPLMLKYDPFWQEVSVSVTQVTVRPLVVLFILWLACWYANMSLSEEVSITLVTVEARGPLVVSNFFTIFKCVYNGKNYYIV